MYQEHAFIDLYADTPPNGHHPWDLQADPGETEELADNGPLALDYADRLRQALAAIDAPDNQEVRLGF